MFTFKQGQPEKAKKLYKVECLNQEKGISSSLRVDEEKREYVVCLCLPRNKMVRTSFPSYMSAVDQMTKYRMLYKSKKETL